MAGIRLDKVRPGSFVRLGLDGGGRRSEELAIFLRVSGEGDDRRAFFVQPNPYGTDVFTWEAYRYHGLTGQGSGYWAYGSSADRLRLLEVIT